MYLISSCFPKRTIGKSGGVVAVKEPCLKGFEYIYDALDVSVGYSMKWYIRKITTRNKETSMFTIHVGDPFSATFPIRATSLPMMKTAFRYLR